VEYVSIHGKSFSKVVCGTNAIYGRSHFSEARNMEYRSRCTDDYIKVLFKKCREFGINAVESSANERIHKILSELNAESERPFQFIGSTRIDDTSQMKRHHEKLRYLIDHAADICIIHSQFVDRPRTKDEITGLQTLVDKIHDAGFIAGISTHQNSTVELCEARAYGIDTYLFPLNLRSYVYSGYNGTESVEERVALIQSVQKPFIIMKPLGGGQIPPKEGLKFVFDNVKPTDIITLGLSSIEEAEESLTLVTEYIS
jgi:hypothetical protein